MIQLSFGDHRRIAYSGSAYAEKEGMDVRVCGFATYNAVESFSARTYLSLARKGLDWGSAFQFGSSCWFRKAGSDSRA